MRPIGSAGQKRAYELPDHLKNRVSFNQNNNNFKKPIIKPSYDDQGLSYGRKLHAAIYQRNQLVSSSRSPSRNPSYQAINKRKIGIANTPNQPYHNHRKFNMDINKSPYVKAVNFADSASGSRNDIPGALQLLKQQRMPGHFN